jgi:hypothetical protein
MIEKTLHKRIYYVPGILTLAIAPILFTVQIKKYISDRNRYCISIVVAEKNYKIGENGVIPSRAYQTYVLTGNIKKDSSTLKLIEYVAKGIRMARNDSIGVKIIINQGLKYSTYINALNSCLKSGINNWIPSGDTIFIFHKNFQNTPIAKFGQNATFIGPVLEGNCLVKINAPEKISFYQRLKNEEGKIKYAVPLFIVFSILVYFSIQGIINEG